MNSDNFIKIARDTVVDYFNKTNDPTNDYQMQFQDTFVVWYNYTLGCMKCLISTIVSDGMYYEITYNAQNNEIYFDAYKKWSHGSIKIGKEGKK